MKKSEIIFLLLILVGIFWILFIPGPRVANDFPYTWQKALQAGFDIPRLWSARGNGFGEYSLNTLWAWPIDFLYGFGAKLGLNFVTLERIIGFFPAIFLGFWSIKKFLQYFKIKGFSLFAGILFYLSNTYFVLLLDGGQISIALTYAWFPAAFIIFIRGLDNNILAKIKGGIALVILGFLDIRFIFVLACLLIVYFIYEILFLANKNKLGYIRKWIISGLVFSFIWLGTNAYWLLPAFFARIPGLPTTYGRVNQAINLSFTHLQNSLLIASPNWYRNVFGLNSVNILPFYLLPVIVLLAPILKARSKVIGFWLLVAVIFIFIAKGANPPLANLYPWIFKNIPGFSLFRDTTKFFFVLILAYSYLIAKTADLIVLKLKNKGWPRQLFKMVFLLYFLFLVSPVYLGKMNGTLSKPVDQKDYDRLSAVVDSDSGFGRTVWISMKPPLGYTSIVHPGLETFRLSQIRPFTSAVAGTYETDNFLRSPYMSELFDIAAIGYISYPYPDTRRVDLKQDNIDYYYWANDKIANFSWLKPIIKLPPVPLYKTLNHQNIFFTTENSLFILGSDDIYQQSTSSANLSLKSNAYIFLEEGPEEGIQLLKYPEPKIIINNKKPIDLAATLITAEKFIFPASYLDFSPGVNSAWWKRESSDHISWRGFLQEKYKLDNQDFDYGGGWAVSEGSNELRIKNKELKQGKILLSRVMVSPKGGNIDFYQGKILVGSINTKGLNQANFLWFAVGNLNNNDQLTIKAVGDINVLNALAILPISEWNNYQNKVQEMIKNNYVRNIEEIKSTENNTIVTYQELSPTHYKINIRGLMKPTTLIFSMAYDPMWQINNQSGIKVYSLFNGFPILKNGDYDLYFYGQKYVIPGLLIGFVTLGLILGYTLLNARKAQRSY